MRTQFRTLVVVRLMLNVKQFSAAVFMRVIVGFKKRRVSNAAKALDT